MAADSTLSINLQVIATELKSGLAAAGASIKAWATETVEALDVVEERAEGLKGVWKDLFEAFLAVEVVEGLKKIAEAAGEASDAMEIAANTARNLGHEAEAATQEDWLERFAASAKGGGFAIDAMRKSLQAFAAIGADTEQQQRLLADAIGLAAMRSLSLEEATRILSLAATGHIAILGRYGIATKDAAGHTLSFAQVMGQLEKAMSGDAAIRAESLEGSFTRLGNAFNQFIAGAFGQELVTIFEGVTNALTRAVDIMNKVPAPVLQAVAAFAAFSLGMVALNLSIAALPLLGRLVVATFENVRTVLGLVATYGLQAARGLVAVGEGAVVASRAMLGLAASEAAAEVPLLAIVAGTVVVGVAIVELISHLNDLGRAWQVVTTYLSEAWGEFVQNVLSSRTALLTFFKDVADAVANPALGGAELGEFAVQYIPKTTMAIYKGVKGGIDSGIAYAKKEWGDFASFIQGIFGSTVQKGPGQTNAPWDGLGGEEKPGKSNPQKATDDALTEAKSQIEAMLAAAQLKVDTARNGVDQSKANLDLFNANNPKITSVGQAQEEQALITAEMSKQAAFKAALLQQENALNKAATDELEIAKRLPASDKDRVAHAAELTKSANDHRLAAARVGIEYTNISVAIAGLVKQMSAPMRELAEQAQKLAEATAEARHAEAAAAIDAEREALRLAERERARTRGPQNPVQSAQDDVSAQAIDVQAAKNDLALAIAKLQAVEESAAASAEDLTKAHGAVTEAEAKLNGVLADARAAQIALTDAIRNSQLNITNVVDKLAETFAKLIPGLTVTQTQSGGLSALFNWTTLLGDAAAKTKAYADIQKVVTQVVQVFAQVLNTLTPIINALLKAFEFFANIIIDVYNIFARLLGLLGIHVQLLSHLNTVFDQMSAPLIAITHSLPTLNELASGNIAPLSDQLKGVSTTTFLSPVTNALAATNLGGGLLGGILEIVAGIEALRLIFAATGLGSGSAGGLLGPIINGIKNLFGGGSGSGAGIPDLGAAAGGDWGDPSNGIVGILDPSAIPSLDTSNGVAGLLAGDTATTAAATDTPATVAMATTGGGASSLSALSALGALGSAFAGAGVGAGISSLLNLGGDSKTGGVAGGAIGGLLTSSLFGAAGTTGGVLAGLQLGAFAGPVGMIGGALLGTLIGSLFGNKTSPGQNPDLYEGQTGYGQKTADLEDGPAGANGQQYAPDQLTQAFVEAMGIGPGTINGASGAGAQAVNSNGTIASSGGVDAVEKWLSGYSATNLPPGVTAQQYQQWVSQFGTSGSGQVTHPDSNISDIAITGSGGAGGVESYATLADSLAQIEELWSSGADALTSIGSTFQSLAANATQVTNGLKNTGNQLVGSVSPSSGSPASTSAAAAQPATVTIDASITVANMNGISDVQNVSNAQAEALQRVLINRPYLITR